MPQPKPVEKPPRDTSKVGEVSASSQDQTATPSSTVTSVLQHSAPTIPDHELIRRIGGGSYGEVWLARSVMGTYRAVKIVYRKSFDHDRPYEREFKGIQKFEPISRSHNGLVDILQIGRNDQAGYFYYVMELADDAGLKRSDGVMESWDNGQTRSDHNSNTPPLQHSASYTPRTLREEINQRGRLPVAECLAIGQALASALAHVHANGLVHRDVKPSNIIFVNGVPKLADIGLVADISEARSFVGTTGFIPPEGPGTPQADLFSLGKVLYEMSTGRDRQDFPQLPGDLRELPDSDALVEFNEILLKACQNDVRERYQSAEAVLADLDRLRGGNSVRRAHQVERQWRFVRRGSAWLAAAAMVVTLIALASRVWQPPQNPESRKRSTNSKANEHYDIGRSHYPENPARAAEDFQAAINADTNFALAQAALAAAWSWGDVGTNGNFPFLSRAKEIAEQALAKDDSLSEAYLALAMHAWIMEWDWPKTEKCFKRALKFDPQNPQPHEWYGQFLRTMGRTNDAIRELETAVNINPRSRTGIHFLGRALLSARRYSEAIGRLEMLVEMQTDSGSLSFLGEALRWGGQIERSITVLAHAAELEGSDPARVAARTEALTRALHEGGEAAFWQKRFEFLRTETSDPLQLASACASVGRTDEALDLLERAYREHHVFLVWDLKAHPEWDSLRGQPRFKALLKKLKLE